MIEEAAYTNLDRKFLIASVGHVDKHSSRCLSLQSLKAVVKC
jgi:hypothetical protein